MKLLLITRHHSEAMHRKAELLATEHGFTVRYVIPAQWRDSLTSARPTARPSIPHQTYSFIGAENDPHRATWRTLDFGMRAFGPDVILAEEEPDSIATTHVAAVRAIAAPQSMLVLYTWQNVNRRISLLARSVRAFALRSAQAMICASAEAEQLSRTFGFRGPIARIPAIGVDTNMFHPPQPSPQQAAAPLVIGYIGRLLEEKGVDTLLEALRHIPDAQLRLIGDGPQRESLKQRAAALGVDARVTFSGSLSGDALVAAYHAMSMLVLPSRTTAVWKEQFGRVLTEAMACGVPVIGSSSGAIPEVIGDAGLIFPEGDVAALAAAICTASAHASELRDGGLRRVHHHFTQERIAARYAAFLSTLTRS